MRLTYKKLVILVNEAFERVGAAELQAYEAYNPRFRVQDIEAGAALIIIRFGRKGDPDNQKSMFSLSYTLSDLEREINKGAVIGFNLTQRYSTVRTWVDAEIKPIFLPA